MRFVSTSVFMLLMLFEWLTETLRNINNGQLAALIAKGIDQFPENTDRLVGTIDIWWIVRILLYEQRFSSY
jgi:hypothetical protein